MPTPNNTTSTCWEDLRERHPACPACKYDLAGLPEPVCPECGGRWRVEIFAAPGFAHRWLRAHASVVACPQAFTACYLLTNGWKTEYSIRRGCRSSDVPEELLLLMCMLLLPPLLVVVLTRKKRIAPLGPLSRALAIIAIVIGRWSMPVAVIVFIACVSGVLNPG